MYVILKQNSLFRRRNRRKKPTANFTHSGIIHSFHCLLWDRITTSYREHFTMLMWRLIAYFWHTLQCNISGPELQHFRYDRRRTDGDLTVMAGKMAKFLLQDNISPSSQQHFWAVYILLDNTFLALHYALYNSSQSTADVV